MKLIDEGNEENLFPKDPRRIETDFEVNTEP